MVVVIYFFPILKTLMRSKAWWLVFQTDCAT